MNQPPLFDPHDHARMSDPVSSHHTVGSSATEEIKPGTYAWDILQELSAAFPWPLCDTCLWHRIEERTGKRLQRNVLARARGRLVRDRMVVEFGMDRCPREGVDRLHFSVPRG